MYCLIPVNLSKYCRIISEASFRGMFILSDRQMPTSIDDPEVDSLGIPSHFPGHIFEFYTIDLAAVAA